MRRSISGLLLLFGATALVSRAAGQDLTPPLAPGTRAPEFTTTTLAGKRLSLPSLRGKVVLLDFWATWCGPCRMSTPTLQGLNTAFHKRGLEVIGLSLDQSDTRARIPAFQHEFGVTYILAYAPQANFRAAMAYHTNMDPYHPAMRLDHPVPPSVFLIDRRGVVRWSQIGYSLDEGQELSKRIRKLLAERR